MLLWDCETDFADRLLRLRKMMNEMLKAEGHRGVFYFSCMAMAFQSGEWCIAGNLSGFRNGSLGQFGADCVVGRKSSNISSCNDFEHLDPPV